MGLEVEVGDGAENRRVWRRRSVRIRGRCVIKRVGKQSGTDLGGEITGIGRFSEFVAEGVQANCRRMPSGVVHLDHIMAVLSIGLLISPNNSHIGGLLY